MHKVTLEQFYTLGRVGYNATCTCGWTTQWPGTSKSDATSASMDHLQEAHDQRRLKADVLSSDVREFILSREELLEHSLRIVREHLDVGIDLSLRALYYALVSEGLVVADRSQGDPTASAADKRANYRRISDTIARAKESGECPLHYLRDDLRVPYEGATVHHDVDPAAGVAEATDYLAGIPHTAIMVDRWYGQPVVPVVVYEKDALTGTLRRPLNKHKVPYLCLRGYPSWPAVYNLYQQLIALYDRIREWPVMPRVEVLYLGDHDPEGMQIPEATEGILGSMVQVDGREIPPLEWHRVALTMEQARASGAPSVGVKRSSSRAKAYMKLYHPTDAWEIEAMGAVAMRDELDRAIAARFDRAIYDAHQAEATHARKELVRRLLGDEELDAIEAELWLLDEDLAERMADARASSWVRETLGHHLD